MRGLFLFQNLRDVVFYECDSALRALICPADLDDLDSFSVSGYGSIASTYKRSSTAPDNGAAPIDTGHILQFFAPVLASHLFLSSETGDGVRELTGSDGCRMIFFEAHFLSEQPLPQPHGLKSFSDLSNFPLDSLQTHFRSIIIFEYTCVLLTTLTLFRAKQIALEMKRILRICLGSNLNRIGESRNNIMDEQNFLRRIFRHLVMNMASQPAFLIQVQENLLLPPDVVEHLSETLRKLCQSRVLRTFVHHAMLVTDRGVASSFSGSDAPVLDERDLRILPTLTNLVNLDSRSTSRASSSTISQTSRTYQANMEDSSFLMQSTTSSQNSDAWLSQSISPLTESGLWTDPVQSLSSQEIVHFVAFFRHADGGVRAHHSWIAELPVSGFRLLLIGRALSQAIVPYTYDALRLLITLFHGAKKKMGQRSFKEGIAGLANITDRIMKCEEFRKMPIALQRNLVSTYEMVQFHNIAARSNEPHIPANTLSKSISLAIETFHRILYLYLQSGARRLSYLRETLDAAIRKGRLLLDKDLRDWEDYLTTRLFTSLPLTSFVGTMQFIIHFIFVDCIKNLCVVPKTPVDIPDEQVARHLEMIIASHRSGKVSFVSMEQDAFTVAYSSYEKSDLENLLHPSSGTLNKETSPKGIGTPCYELYSWHECSTPFDQIKLQQNWLTIRCVEMATLKPIKKQSMAHRIFRR